MTDTRGRQFIEPLTDSTGGVVQADNDISGSTADDIATIVAKLNAVIDVLARKSG